MSLQKMNCCIRRFLLYNNYIIFFYKNQILAEEVGFEPTPRLSRANALAERPLEPLEYSSMVKKNKSYLQTSILFINNSIKCGLPQIVA